MYRTVCCTYLHNLHTLHDPTCVCVCCVTHLVEFVGTLAAQVVLAGQDDHRLVEQLQADGADQLFLQRHQRRLMICCPAAPQGAQVGGQWHGLAAKLHLLLETPDITDGQISSHFTGAGARVRLWVFLSKYILYLVICSQAATYFSSVLWKSPCRNLKLCLTRVTTAERQIIWSTLFSTMFLCFLHFYLPVFP